MSAAQVPWAGLRYKPVTPVRDRVVARWLRTQRKTMLRLFDDRGLFDLSIRLRRLVKNPTLNVMEKNRRFQEILDAYAKLMRPAGEPTAAPEASSVVSEPGVEVPDSRSDGSDPIGVSATGSGLDAQGSVLSVASDDRAGVVIEEGA